MIQTVERAPVLDLGRLLRRRANPNADRERRERRLLDAAMDCDAAEVRGLLDQVADVNERGPSGYYALIWATRSCRLDLLPAPA